jgi:hypothetical protein
LARTQGSERKALLTLCEQLLRRLRREAWEPAETQAYQIEATLALVNGDAERAAERLERSAVAQARDGATIHAAAARLAGARISNNPALAEVALAEIRALCVVNPERMAYALVPLPFAPH